MRAGLSSLPATSASSSCTLRVEARPLTETQRLTADMVQGDESAYHEFFARYFDRLLRYLIVAAHGDEELAREALQASLIRVSRRIRIFPADDDLWRWLTTIARHTLVDEQRKRGRRQSLWTRIQQHFAHSPPPPPAVDEPDPENAWLTMLQQGLEDLSLDDRLLLRRKYDDRQSVRTIANELGTTEKAIESRLSRLRLKLRQTVLSHLRHES